MSDVNGGQYIPINPSYNSGYEDGRKTVKARIADLERQVSAEKERADYAWRNTNTIEKARQEELAKRDALTTQVAALTKERDAWREDANISKASIDMLKGQREHQYDQLSASQAREQKLREALASEHSDHVSLASSELGIDPWECEALALPQDDSALQARLAEEHKAGYAAAIEAVKAGGVVTWMLGDDVYRVKQVRLFTHPPGQEIPGQIPLYKLPEDV